MSSQPRFRTLIALTAVGFTTLATSQVRTDETLTASAEVITWTGERTSAEVVIGVAEDAIPNGDWSAEQRMNVTVHNVTEDQLEEIRWRVTFAHPDDEDVTFQGVPTRFENGEAQADGTVRGDAVIEFGRLCADGEVQDCFPCSLIDGCTFTLDLDLCAEPPHGDGSATIDILPSEGGSYSVACTPDATAACDDLDAWIEAETSELVDSLCGG